MKPRNANCRVPTICLLLGWITGGCGTPFDTPRPVSSDVIQVEYVTGPNLSKAETLTFWIKNTSNSCIAFPYDFGLKIYYQNKDTWLETSNEVQYLSDEQDILLQPDGELFSQSIVDLRPDLTNL
jgi:hypothetical protein